MPVDISTAILVDEQGAHTHSTSVLRLFLYMGFAYEWMGLLALRVVPRFVRDAAYRLFARNRGQIWIGVKRVTGMGDTWMEPYRDRVLGLEEPLDPSWGFETMGK
jgi:predicted DCC family thiol-disulfide oxidoreductase YuxK